MNNGAALLSLSCSGELSVLSQIERDPDQRVKHDTIEDLDALHNRSSASDDAMLRCHLPLTPTRTADVHSRGQNRISEPGNNSHFSGRHNLVGKEHEVRFYFQQAFAAYPANDHGFTNQVSPCSSRLLIQIGMCARERNSVKEPLPERSSVRTR